jgi:P-type Ca2+ transporter type 2C
VNYYQKEAIEVIEELKSHEETGLTSDEALRRTERYGKNSFTPKQKGSLFAKIVDSIKEPLIVILLISGVISLAMGHLPDGLGIFAAVLIATTISVIQEGKSDKAFEALTKLSEDVSVKVVRDHQIIYIPQSELTIGDIIHLETGDKVPADARIIHSANLEIDESMLTGEAEPSSKRSSLIDRADCPLAERLNMIYTGTLVTEGRVIAIVTGIGDGTEMGKIAQELKEEEDTDTPLQQKLADLGKRISIEGQLRLPEFFVMNYLRFINRK